MSDQRKKFREQIATEAGKCRHVDTLLCVECAARAVDDVAWRDIRVTIMPGWGDAGRQGTALAQVTGADGMSWTVVRWDVHDEDERLGLHKSSGLAAGEWA